MSTKGGLIFLISSIVLVLSCIIALIGIYYFDWLKPASSGYTLYTATPDNDARFAIKDEPANNEIMLDAAPASDKLSDKSGQTQSAASYSDNAAAAAVSAKTADETAPASAQMLPSKMSSPNRTSSGNPVARQQSMPAPRFAKAESAVKPVPTGKDGSPIKISFTFDKNRNFHSYGQYISADEYKYRLAVINNLSIKTVIIDSVSPGNGISQEYYKVAYNANMIPARILDEIVTSKEFRTLIPKQYLRIEEKMAAFPNGGKVTFANSDIKDLLILWSQGKLTPTQKAWQVRAAM